MDIMEILIAVLVFTAVIGTIATSVVSGGNLTGASLVLYGLIPLFIVIGFIKYVTKKSGAKR